MKLYIYILGLKILLWFATLELFLAALERERVWSTVVRIVSGW